jgi:hypothetical protein
MRQRQNRKSPLSMRLSRRTLEFESDLNRTQAMAGLEERVEALEREIQELRGVVRAGTPAKDWRRTIGMFAGDDMMRRIMDAALEYREEDRRKTRPKPKAKRKRRKP